MSDARRYAVWPEPRSRSLKGSRPSVPHGTNFFHCVGDVVGLAKDDAEKQYILVVKRLTDIYGI